MNDWRARWVWLAVSMVLAALAPLACGGEDAGGGARSGGTGGSSSASTGVGFGGDGMLESLSIDPPTASIECVDGALAMQQFTANLHHSDGSTEALAGGVSWSATAPQVGTIDATGLYTANGMVGDVVTVKAEYKGS